MLLAGNFPQFAILNLRGVFIESLFESGGTPSLSII
jgi:hypothetical protein